jgi:hypothetical protein
MMKLGRDQGDNAGHLYGWVGIRVVVIRQSYQSTWYLAVPRFLSVVLCLPNKDLVNSPGLEHRGS